MANRRIPEPQTEPEESQLRNALFRLRPEAKRAFDHLKVEQGPRSGPRLIAEAIDLLLKHYGKKPVGFASSDLSIKGPSTKKQ